ncbi:MAG: hypothetical protein RML75_00495 [Cyanobacteriota bacterium SKYGB_h_bin112]|nr:hypothetical protein [Cyanobacteriota bacterium SKYGB_h_bin112]
MGIGVTVVDLSPYYKLSVAIAWGIGGTVMATRGTEAATPARASVAGIRVLTIGFIAAFFTPFGVPLVL